MRVLDLGCGQGISLRNLGVADSDEVVGVDIDESDLDIARNRFPNRRFIAGRGEDLCFLNEGSFDLVICEVSLPYMNIPRALAEIYRVLKPGGSVFLSLHSARFTLTELVKTALPKPIPSIYRLYVLGNGVWFYITGRNFRFSKKRIESFQSERGIKKALERAGFTDLRFTRTQARFIVEIIKK